MNLPSLKSFLNILCLTSALASQVKAKAETMAMAMEMEMDSPQMETAPDRHEYQVVLVTPDGSYEACTGSLIAPRYVLTSGFCASTASHFSKVQIGRHDLSDNSEDFEEINIESIVIDEKNSGKDYYEDTVAILKLERESSIEPVPFDKGNTDLSDGTDVSVLGWGIFSSIAYDDDSVLEDFNVDGLLETETQVTSSDECEEIFSAMEISAEKFMCTNRTTDIDSLFDPCHGDYGSAVIVKGGGSDSSSSDVQVGMDLAYGCGIFVNDDEDYTDGTGSMLGFVLRLSYFNDFIDCVLSGGTEDCGRTITLDGCNDFKGVGGFLKKLLRGSI